MRIMHTQGATNSGHIPVYHTIHMPGAFWSVDLDIYVIVTRAMFNIQLTASEQASILQRFSFAVEYL